MRIIGIILLAISGGIGFMAAGALGLFIGAIIGTVFLVALLPGWHSSSSWHVTSGGSGTGIGDGNKTALFGSASETKDKVESGGSSSWGSGGDSSSWGGSGGDSGGSSSSSSD